MGTFCVEQRRINGSTHILALTHLHTYNFNREFIECQICMHYSMRISTYQVWEMFGREPGEMQRRMEVIEIECGFGCEVYKKKTANPY